MRRWIVEKPFASPKGCSLGEGPFYDDDQDQLRFFDIDRSKLYMIKLADGPSSLLTYDLAAKVSVSGAIQGSKTEVIVAAKEGFAKLNLETQQMQYVKNIWDASTAADVAFLKSKIRFNDGGVDPQGRFWAGTMTETADATGEGTLYRLDADGSIQRMIEGVSIPNGLAWSLASNLMYFIDSPTQAVYCYEFDGSNGSISNRRLFYQLNEEDRADGAVPDGLTLDEAGNLWIALYNGGKVIRVSVKGEKIAEVILPTRCVTCPTFAGTRLFITTAKDRSNENDELGGSLFMVDVGVAGACKYAYRFDD